MTRRVATVGVAEHSSVPVLVTIAASGDLLDRREVQLIEPGLSAFPHHAEGSWAVGRYLDTPGARVLPLDDVVALVERVRQSALRGARDGLAAIAAAVSVPIGAIAIRACPPLPATIVARIRDNRAQAVADSVMYREALAVAADERGWTVHWYDREVVWDEAAQVMRVRDIAPVLAAMGKLAGPPWLARHKLAAAAAIAARAQAALPC